MIETTNCVFCGSDKFEVLYSRKDARFSLDENVYSMNQCKDCRGLYLSPRIRESEIWNYYPVDYYYEQLPPGEIMKRELHKNVGKYRYLMNMKPGKLLDVGCRDGSFVKFMELFDWDSEGYEINQSVTNRFNCKISYGDFSQLKEASYDVITLWAVFEHLYDPKKYLIQISEMLKPGGYLIIQVPKYDSFTGKILLHEDVPRHVTAFTSKWINSYIEKFGFRRVRNNTRCTVFWGSSQGFLIYFIWRLVGNSKDEALRAIYRTNRVNLDSSLAKVDLFLSKHLDKALRKLDYWGQMTSVFQKEA